MKISDMDNFISTNHFVAGDIIFFVEGVVGGTCSRPKCLGKRKILARVIQEKPRNSYMLEVFDAIGVYSGRVIDKKLIVRSQRDIFKHDGVFRLAEVHKTAVGL